MRRHECTNVLETDFSWSARRQDVLDTPVCRVSARAKEDRRLLLIPNDLICREVEFGAFDIRLAVSRGGVELIYHLLDALIKLWTKM